RVFDHAVVQLGVAQLAAQLAVNFDGQPLETDEQGVIGTPKLFFQSFDFFLFLRSGFHRKSLRLVASTARSPVNGQRASGNQPRRATNASGDPSPGATRRTQPD